MEERILEITIVNIISSRRVMPETGIYDAVEWMVNSKWNGAGCQMKNGS